MNKLRRRLHVHQKISPYIVCTFSSSDTNLGLLTSLQICGQNVPTKLCQSGPDENACARTEDSIFDRSSLTKLESYLKFMSELPGKDVEQYVKYMTDIEYVFCLKLNTKNIKTQMSE